MVTEWRRISGSTSGDGGGGDAGRGPSADAGSFCARRPAAFFDSWRK
jgi:hypothetical protein